MREIKFRVWCRDKNEWEKDEVFLSESGAQWHSRKLIPVKPDNHILMLFTGLRDRTGKEIYEGDIITTALPIYPFVDDNKPNYVGVVQWLFAGFEYVLQCVNPNKAGISNGINEPLQEGEPFLVIGNIYETPELIRQDG